MPTYKHPCPYCGKFIDKIAAACPYCGQADPFAPKRCLGCRKIVEDPAWVVCPSCGASLITPSPGATTAATGSAARTPAAGAPAQAQASGTQAAGSTAPQPAPAPRPSLNPEAAAPVLKSAGPCSGCGAPLPAGARFCTICGTMAG
jgi:RNA polymerase subunit RPABC4/transcription elongation factor Spt4